MDLVTIQSSEAHVQTPQYGEYPYTSVNHITLVVAATDSCFVLMHENSSERHSPRREVSLAIIDPAGYYRGEYRFSQSPSLLISGSGSWPQPRRTFIPCNASNLQEEFSSCKFDPITNGFTDAQLIKPDHAG